MSLTPELAQWRKSERAALIARRLAAPAIDRAAWSGQIEQHLRTGFPALGGLVVGFCWPYQGEFDARTVVRELRRHGARAALPVVVECKSFVNSNRFVPGPRIGRGIDSVTKIRRASTGRNPSSPSVKRPPAATAL